MAEQGIFSWGLPNDILTNKNLTANEKLLYSIFLGFHINQKDCFLSNQCLGEILGLSDRSISKSINKLKTLGLVCVKIEQSFKRYITATLEENFQGGKKLASRGVEENFQGGRSGLLGGVEENFYIINNTNIKSNKEINKNMGLPPQTPKLEKKDTNKKIKINDLESIIPSNHHFEMSKQSLEKWFNYRNTVLKKPLKEHFLKEMSKKLLEFSDLELKTAVDDSVFQGWQGLFLKKINKNITLKTNETKPSKQQLKEQRMKELFQQVSKEQVQKKEVDLSENNNFIEINEVKNG